MNEHAEHHPVAEAHEHFGHDNSPEAIQKEIRRYLLVFGALAVLTIITVAISRLRLPTHEAIAIALTVAIIKGSLVAAFFMHLISERKLIYAVLLITVFFFGMLLWGPWHQRYNAQKIWKGYDLNASQPAPAAPIENPGHSGH
jgi:cytochrome c oxidase subunit IV